MSRVGKKPIQIPENVEVKIEGKRVIIKGPKGEISREFRPEIKIEIKEKKVFVSPQIQTKQTNAFWGLTRASLNNLIKGVTEGYEKKLEIEGLGYKAILEVPVPQSGGPGGPGGPILVLHVGFSHPVKIKAPPEIKFSIEKNIITVSGIDKELVGRIAAQIKKVRPADPYKGKGIKYLGEVIRKKVGKKVVATTV